MAIPAAHYDLFKAESDFQQILFLDNFDQHVNIGVEPSSDISRLLITAVNDTKSLYVKRSAFVILCDLTLAGVVTNSFAVIGLLHDFLWTGEEALQIIGLKYLPFFAEARTLDIVQKLKELSDSPNADVSSQAYCALGLFELSGNVSSTNRESALLTVVNARKYFEASFVSVENREDAQFYIVFAEWAQALLSNNIEVSSAKYEELNRIFSLRVLYEYSEKRLELEYLIFKVLQNLEASLGIAIQSQRWLDVTTKIQELCEISARIDSLKVSDRHGASIVNKLFAAVFDKLEESIYVRNLSSEKPRLGEIQSGKTQLQVFINHLISLFPDDPTEPFDNPELLAVLAENLGSSDGLETYRAIGDKGASSDVVNVVGSLLRKNKNGAFPFRTGSIPGDEIYQHLISQIRNFLPDYPSEKMEVFSNILEEVIRYANTTFTGSDRREFVFLFAETLDGKGVNAVEEDLQDSMLNFLRHSKIADGLEHEKAKFVDSGRVDIVYVRDIITIPIELKRSFIRPDQTSLEENYIAQAQTYTAGYDQLGVFVILELSDKSTEPPPNIRDWFRIHHVQPSTSLAVKFPDYVISVVIPGNRTTPHKRSTYNR